MEKLYFKNGKFKIMQVADTQEFSVVNPDTVINLSLAVIQEKPDLVIFTGDQIHGVDPTYKLGNLRENVKRTLSKILGPVVRYQIPFAVTYGNHDAQCGLTNAEQAEIYAAFPGFIPGTYRSEDDRGTFLLPVYNEADAAVFNIFAFDSGMQEEDGAYAPVSEAQLSFFKETMLKESRPTLVFQHIPVPEFYDVLQKVKKGTPGAVEAFRTHKNEYYTLPESIISEGGFMGESPAVPDENSGEFAVLKESGNVLSIAVGHDHKNSFVSDLDGIKLIYTQGAGFNVYGPHAKRGVRIFEIDEAAPADFTTRTVTFEALSDGQFTYPIYELLLSHIPTSVEQVRKIPVLGPIVAGAANAFGKQKK